MAGTNLSTRPFYNERAVRAILGVVLLVVVALTAFHVISALALRREERLLSARATQAQDDAARLRAQAQAMAGQIDAKELAVLSAATREVNDAIDRRTFSWGTFLTDVEATLPGDVKVLSLQPKQEKGRMAVAVNVEARDNEELGRFMDALEARGSFQDVLPRGENTTADAINAILEATYRPASALVEAGGGTGRARARTSGGKR